jgi:transcriptional regulator with XRE-family HTH domain
MQKKETLLYMLSEQLRELREKSGMTINDIAERSGVPIATVKRVLHGEVERHNFETIVAIVRAMGGSVDELVGMDIPRAEETKSQPTSAADDTAQFYISAIKNLQWQLEETRGRIKTYQKWLVRIFALLLILLGIIILITIHDFLTPTLGHIRNV